MTNGRLPRTGDALPLWLKLSFTTFVMVLVPVYWWHYGPANFLWFSDLALFAIVVTLWLEHPLPVSMATLGVLSLELVWTFEFLSLLVAGTAPLGLAAYMFNEEIPIGVRAISLFHLVLPPLLVWLVRRLGYDRRALAAQTALALVVLPVTYLVSDPMRNVNWVFGPGSPQTVMPPGAYLALLMLFMPLAVYVPTHALFTRLLPKLRGFSVVP